MAVLLRSKARGNFRASVDDTISRQMEGIRGGEFLQNRVFIRVGQRVEVKFMSETCLDLLFFFPAK